MLADKMPPATLLHAAADAALRYAHYLRYFQAARCLRYAALMAPYAAAKVFTLAG